MKQREQSIYFSAPMQMYISAEIKRPLIHGVVTLFSSGSSHIEKAKAVREVWKAYKAFKALPQPTIENTVDKDAQNVLRLRDWFLGHCFLDRNRLDFVSSIFCFVAMIVSFDAPWRFIIAKVRQQAMSMDWNPPTGIPEGAWWKS